MAFSRLFLCAAVSGLVVFGALNTLTTKIQLSLSSLGTAGVEKPFQKPWFATFAMFAGMALVLVPYHCIEARKNSSGMAADAEQQLLEKSANGNKLSERLAFCYVGIPAMFDLVASGLMFCGLIFITASIWQMLRGSEIVFAAIISVPALGHKLYAYHWIGVLLCVAGICTVGAANVLNSRGSQSTSSPEDALFGMGLVVASQVVQAAQMVAEEKLLKDVELPPMKIVGYEGLWGSLVCLIVVFPMCALVPGSDNGSLEDTIDTVTMIKNNGALLGLIAIYIFSCATYNVAGMLVTNELSAVHRTMLEASRTLFIWVVDLVVHSINANVSFGEAWMPYSPLQLVGFAILLMGQSVYGSVIKIPGLYYPPDEPMPQQWQSPSAMMALSPLPRTAPAAKSPA